MIHDQITPSHCGIPSNNPTRPSVPPDFAFQVIGGTISLSWGEPATRPVGTVYQLWSAPNCLTHVDSKVLVYEGDSLGKVLVYSVNSPMWFQLSARAGSYQSAFSPTTYGTGVTPEYAPPPAPSSTWGASIAPTNLTKFGTTAQLTTAAANVTVTASNAPTFTWSNPGSANVKINNPSAAATTFTGSGMSLGEQRLGTFWCGIVDGANSSSKSVVVSVYRQDPS